MAGLVVVLLAATLALIVSGGQGTLAEANIIYVDAEAKGLNNGGSWRNAFTDLQDALDEAEPLDQIWVAAGTYKPTRQFIDGDPRSAAFQMVNGVAIYGGFQPDEGITKLEDRDWVAHEAILSGDIGIEGDPADNSYHVFYTEDDLWLDGSAILDGFTITGGNANEPDYPGGVCGGGMYSDHSLPTLNNISFVDNSADYGGALYVGAPLTITEPLTLTNVTFVDNSAERGGGAYLGVVLDVPPGAVSDTLPFRLTNCTFWGNVAELGGGAYLGVEGDVPPGAVSDTLPFRLTNCTFWGNVADLGGGLFITWGEPDTGTPPLRLTNCTFSGNQAEHGGAIYALGPVTSVMPLNLTNSILWGDAPDEIYTESPENAPIVTYSDIQGGYEGEGNIDEDPAFVDPDAGDLHLQPGSVCIDAANNGPELAQYDFEGDERILDGDGDGWAVVDMGVDEFKMPTISVEVDVTPYIPNNVIKLRSGVVVDVAILSDEEFDAVAEVAPDTVQFAGASHVGFTFVDVDKDGHDDVLLDFRAQDMVDLDEDSTEATLTGETLDGMSIEGTDEVKVR
jgi:predicted outer membrane repeat protein